MSIDMILPNQAIKMMYDSLNEQSASATSNFFDEKVLKYSIPNMVEDKTFKRLGDNMEEELAGKNLEELQKTFFITDLQFNWDQSRRAFTNNTGDFGLRSIDKYLVERRINGKVEIVKKRGGDEMTIYLQQPQGSWYYFKYQKGVMAILSSDILFNELIKTNIDRVSKEKEGYQIRQANISDRNKFVRSLKK
jgi:glucan-binding YG repeat protein